MNSANFALLDFSHLRAKGIDTLLTPDAPGALNEVLTPYRA
jgi:hypothetical protein